MEVMMIIDSFGKVVAIGHFEMYSDAMKFAEDFFNKNGVVGYTVVNPTFYAVSGNEVCDLMSDVMQASGWAFMQAINGNMGD